jgi:hypothetical protein
MAVTREMELNAARVVVQLAQSVQHIKDGILALAASCDGAFSEDGAGFSKHDAYTGHDFAEKIKNDSTFTAKQLKYMQSLCVKYRRQLIAKGFSLELIQQYDADAYLPPKKEEGPEYLPVTCVLTKETQGAWIVYTQACGDTLIGKSLFHPDTVFVLDQKTTIQIKAWIVNKHKLPIAKEPVKTAPAAIEQTSKTARPEIRF